MSELELKLKYPSLAARLFFIVDLLSFPLWGLFAPLTFLMMVLILSFHMFPFNGRDLIDILGFMGSLCLIFSMGALGFVLCRDDRLIIRKDGIRLPFHSSIAFGFRKNIQWSEITSVQVIGTGNGSSNCRVLFRTSSQKKLSIDCSKLTPSDLEQFILALEIWCNRSIMDQKILEIKENLQHHLSSSELGSDSKSYTQIWEDELERRFNNAAYLVMDPGASLQDGRLVVKRQLSFGGFSAIYLCQRNKRDLLVLKETALPPGSNENLLKLAEESLGREARLLQKIEHPNVVHVQDYFVENGRHYLLLEHVDGPDLRAYVKEHGCQSETTVLGWAHTLVDVLKYLHEQEPPIIHRDLSPDNIVVDSANQLKVIDFGAANEFLGSATGTVVGKQAYLPLEQLQGRACPQSDVYALGCSLHFLLTGEEAEPLAQSYPKSKNPELSDELNELVAACTEQDWQKRPDLQEVSATLETLRTIST